MNSDGKVAELHTKLQQLRDELRGHSQDVGDPACAALCETSAEAIDGLATAFKHYEEKSEPAWQK